VDRIEQPRNKRSRRTRAAILDATWALLDERGAEGLSIDEVAQRAGVSRRGIYLHFGSRAALLIALIEHVDAALDLEASVRPVREAPDAVSMLMEFAAHLARYHPLIMHTSQAVARARHSDPDAAALWNAASENWLAGCRDIAQRLADEGMLAEPWTVSAAADLLWALMSLELLEDLTVERGWSQEEYRERLALLLLRTLVRPQSS
jgi:AcrR family transcriptional regulator